LQNELIIKLTLVVTGGSLGDTAGSDVIGLEVTGGKLGRLVSGLSLDDTVGSDEVGFEVSGDKLGVMEGYAER
jgi:hypothetical protein